MTKNRQKKKPLKKPKGLCHASSVMSGKNLNTLYLFITNLFSKTYWTLWTYFPQQGECGHTQAIDNRVLPVEVHRVPPRVGIVDILALMCHKMAEAESINAKEKKVRIFIIPMPSASVIVLLCNTPSTTSLHDLRKAVKDDLPKKSVLCCSVFILLLYMYKLFFLCFCICSFLNVPNSTKQHFCHDLSLYYHTHYN